MEAQAFEYWHARLAEGAVFASFKGRNEGYDFARSVVDKDARWPKLVARDSLYADYVNWVMKTKHARPGAKSEFFRVLQPYLYIYGKQRHTARRDVNKRMLAGERIVSGRVQRYFIKMPPVHVCRAHARLVMGKGTRTEQENDRQLIKRYERVFSLTPSELLQMREDASDAQVPQT